MRLLATVLLATFTAWGQPLPGTAPVEMEGDLAARMMEGMDRYLTRELARSPERRAAHWKRDFSSPEAYLKSVAANRERFRRIIGLFDPRVPFESPSVVSAYGDAQPLAATAAYRVLEVRWPVLKGVEGSGLLLQPTGPVVARVVVVPDADWSPELLAGLEAGVRPQFARRLAENGCLVLIPDVLSRKPVGLFRGKVRGPTNQTHREFVYRMAFEMGRHVAGLEVQKILAAVDWFSRSTPAAPIGVMGYGEGGLLALYAAAADARLKATVVSGYFQPREEIWREPVYRNVWGLLTEFGDAELAGLVAPRLLVVEASRGPETGTPAGPGTGAAPGALLPPLLSDVRAEVDRAAPVFKSLGVAGNLKLVTDQAGRDEPGCERTLSAFLRGLGVKTALKPSGSWPETRRAPSVAAAREQRQFEQLVEFVQQLVRHSEGVRREFWSKADASSVEKWVETREPYRRYLWEEIFGKLPPASEPLAARTRRVYDNPRWTGYDVVLPVLPDVFAYGILLVPKDLTSGERRPVVVAQHGRSGRPQRLIETAAPEQDRTYKHFAAQLADLGFVVYAPQNPYIFEEQYRYLQRKANPLKLSLFSFILSQHQRTLEWLASLPFVDPKRIGFYGLSYGGKTAVRVPPLLDGYALSICSGDFNEYAGKMAATDRPDSFMYTVEHEMYEFNLGSTFNYSDMANLMAPRPFMVERGHKDGVGLDEWVAYEYAKVRRFYAFLGIPERTTIEFFNGIHEIHADGTFRFLREQLNWPARPK